MKRRGRKPLPDRFYAGIAAAYVAALERGSRHPGSDAAKAFSLSSPRVRDILHTARERGLLTPSPQGVRGGALTAKARKLLGVATTRRAPYWISAPIPKHPDWRIAYRIVLQAGTPVVGEVRVYSPSGLPIGGLSARVLRQARMNDWRA